MKKKNITKMAYAMGLMMATSGMVIPYNVLTMPVIAKASSEEIKDAKVIDISQVEIVDNCRKICINQSGKYVLTGSNYVPQNTENGSGGVYVDTQIVVNGNVTADIYMKDFSITNDDYVFREADSESSSPVFEGYQTPIIINGTANVHIMDDSTIEAVQNIIEVNGTLNIVESKVTDSEQAQLSVKLSKTNDTKQWGYNMIDGNGKVSIENSNVFMGSRDGNNSDISEYINTDFSVSDSTFQWKGSEKKKFPDRNIIMDDSYITIDNLQNPKLYNNKNQQLVEKELKLGAALAEKQVLQVNQYTTLGVNTDSSGILKAYLPEGQETTIFIGDKAYTFTGDNTTNPTVSSYRKLTFIDTETNETMTSYFNVEKAVIKLPSSSKWDYTFYCKGNKVTDASRVTEDMVIYVVKSIKTFTVIIDGISRIVDYGTKIGEIGNKLYYNADDKTKFYYSEDEIVSDLNLCSVNLTMQNNECIIGSAEELTLFSKTVNDGGTALNAKLTSDIVTTDDYKPIGNDTNRYRGTFDGQGHSVQLNINSSEKFQGMFGTVTGGVTVKNVVTKGTVQGGYACGGIIGGSKGYGTVIIDGCINYANVTSTTGSDGAGIIGTNGESKATFIITNCGNHGNIKSTNFTCAISGWSGKSATIKNCYNMGKIEKYYGTDSFVRGENATIENCYQINTVESQSDSGLETVTAEQFRSGEVTYKLNGSSNSSLTGVWGQNLREGQEFPVISNDRVYCVAMKKCDGTDLGKGYSNVGSEDLTEKIIHSFHYTATGASVTGICSMCNKKVTATVTASDSVLNSIVAYGGQDTLFVSVEKSEGYEEEGKLADYKWYVKEGDVSEEDFTNEDLSDDKIISTDAVYKTEPTLAVGNHTFLCVLTCDGYAVRAKKTIRVKSRSWSSDWSSSEPTPSPSAVPSPSPSPEPSASPSIMPSVSTSVMPSSTPTVKPSPKPTIKPTKTPAVKVPGKGTTIKDKAGIRYKVASTGKNPTVAYDSAEKGAKGAVSIPKTKKIGGITYKITEVSQNAFKNNKNITKITIGDNVKKIGKNAFKGCKNLKQVMIGKSVSSLGSEVFEGCNKLEKITLKTTKLKAKNVSKTAFAGMKSSVKVEVPKSVYKKYKGFFYDRGLNKKAKIKKSK